MAIRDISNVWRNKLVMASFRGVGFHVEVVGRSSGRRTVVHEYPKRDLPYSEDMGRAAVRFAFTAYLVHLPTPVRGMADLITQRDLLCNALEAGGAGPLVHPTMGSMLCMCERYVYTESRERGGYYEFQMNFVEAGDPKWTVQTIITAVYVGNQAGVADVAATNRFNTVTGAMGFGEQ